MAVITPSSLISEIRGSVGDVTYSRNRYGPYVKAKLTQPASATDAQILRRDALTLGVTNWKTLSDAEYLTWAAYVSQHLEAKNISRKIRRAAFDEFIGRYVNRSLVDTALSGFTPQPSVRLFPSITSFTQAFDSITVNIETENFAANCAYVIYATAPMSDSIRVINKSNYKVLTFYTPTGASDSIDIFTLYDAVYSLTSANVGDRIGIAVKAVNLDNYAGGKISYNNFILESAVIAAPPSILQGRTLIQANSGSATVSLAAPPTSGNLMIAIMNPLGTKTITPPSGWTSFQYEALGGVTIEAFRKVAGGSETNSYTFTTTATPDWHNAIFEIIDCDTSSPIDFSTDNNNGGVAGKVLNSASADQTPADNTLVFAALGTVGSANITTVSNSFVIGYTSGTLLQVATRKYFSSVAGQNAQWNWQTNRTAVSLFFSIKPTP